MNNKNEYQFDSKTIFSIAKCWTKNDKLRKQFQITYVVFSILSYFIFGIGFICFVVGLSLDKDFYQSAKKILAILGPTIKTFAFLMATLNYSLISPFTKKYKDDEIWNKK